MLFGRLVVRTTLTAIPRDFRLAPGVIAVTDAEFDAMEKNDRATFKKLAALVLQDDLAALDSGAR